MKTQEKSSICESRIASNFSLTPPQNTPYQPKRYQQYGFHGVLTCLTIKNLCIAIHHSVSKFSVIPPAEEVLN
jgi:hypothetical protein